MKRRCASSASRSDSPYFFLFIPPGWGEVGATAQLPPPQQPPTRPPQFALPARLPPRPSACPPARPQVRGKPISRNFNAMIYHTFRPEARIVHLHG